MWLSKKVLLLILVGALAGCGFRPLYGTSGTTGSGGPVVDEFSAIKIERVANRTGQQLHNHLLDLLTPRGQPATPAYLLRVTLRESKREIAVRSTGLATRANVRVNAKFALVDMATGDLLTNGTARAFSSYNLTDSEFSNLTAEKDTLSQATRIIAADIRARLGAYFTGRDPA